MAVRRLNHAVLHVSDAARSAAFWATLALITFAIVVAGYGAGLWHLGA